MKKHYASGLFLHVVPTQLNKESSSLSLMKTFVINLDRRPDRYESFQKRLQADWPFGPAERFAAVEGQRETLPEWWTAGRGAYGCYQSHLQIIERCIADGAESVLILEDDATFVPGFAAHAQAFLANLPNDWAMAYFGGQHLKQKEPPDFGGSDN